MSNKTFYISLLIIFAIFSILPTEAIYYLGNFAIGFTVSEIVSILTNKEKL